MKASIDISYYPLHEEFKTPIENFIEALKKNEKIAIKVNNMSTQIFGEYADLMAAVTKCMKSAFDLPRSVFILKIVNDDLNEQTNLSHR